MKLYDISQEITGCKVYPGDPSPERKIISSMNEGALYNLSSFSMCAHNGTHIDAPSHFIKDGKTIDEIPLEKYVGPCYVTEHTGEFTAEDAEKVLEEADGEYGKRILIKGKMYVSEGAAKVFSEKKIFLIGNESQTVGPEDAPMKVHLELLGNDVVLLEGVMLENIKKGKYLLMAAPLNLKNSEGSPCRAVLAEIQEIK